VWANLDGNPTPEASWNNDFSEQHLQGRFTNINFEDYSYHHTWDQPAPINWKVLADPFNDVFHAQHNGAEGTKESTDYALHTVNMTIEHSNPTSRDQSGKSNVPTTYHFPNASISIT
jgi:hypothetical protein